MTSLKLPSMIRDVMPGDREFILSSWLSTNLRSPFARDLRADPQLRMYAEALENNPRPDPYFWLHRQLLERKILPASKILVECYEEDRTLILGWVAAQPDKAVLHYVCVKPEYKGAGVARRLVESVFGGALPVTLKYTHLTDDIEMRKVPAGWTFERAKRDVRKEAA